MPTPDEQADDAQWERPQVRVDARLLEATLLNLRKRVAAVPLVFDIPGTDEVTAERAKLVARSTTTYCPGSASRPRRFWWPSSARPARANRRW
ncbi:MAG: hypothetical protein ACRDOI_38655 [Trebonia sp.]